MVHEGPEELAECRTRRAPRVGMQKDRKHVEENTDSLLSLPCKKDTVDASRLPTCPGGPYASTPRVSKQRPSRKTWRPLEAEPSGEPPGSFPG